MRTLITALLCCSLMLTSSHILAGPTGTPTSQGSAERIAELRTRIGRDNRVHPVASVAWGEEALRLLAAEPNPDAESYFLFSLVRDLNVLGDYPKASTYLERGRNLAVQTRNGRSRLLLETEAAINLTYTERYGDAQALLASILPSLESYRVTHPQDLEVGLAEARSYRILGWGLQIGGKFQEAIQAYQQAQALSEELKDLRGKAQVLDIMGNLYMHLGRFDEATASHLQAIAVAETLADIDLQARCHNSLSTTYGQRNETDLQLKELRRASALAIQAGDAFLQLLISVNLGSAHLRGKNYPVALRWSEAALNDLKISQFPLYRAASEVNRGIALNRLGQSADGLRSLQKGLQYLKATNSRNETAEATGNLAEEFAFAGDFRRAYEAEVEFKAISDELQRAEIQKRVAEASAAFESDNKQGQIDRLVRDKHTQARLKLMWIALGVLGFSIAGILVVSRRTLQRVNGDLTVLNEKNNLLIGQLQTALAEVKTLRGLIPICAHCKKIRDDQGFWNQMESYIQSRSGAKFSHGICPDCAQVLMAGIQQAELSDQTDPSAPV